MSKASQEQAYAVVAPIPGIPAIGTLTYAIPAHATSVRRGMRVVVPLGGRHVTGIVTALETDAPQGVECRELVGVLDATPVLTDELLDLARWIADYYLASFGEVLALAIGRGLTAASRRTVILLDASKATTAGQQQIVHALRQLDGRGDAVKLARALGRKSIDGPLATLAARGAIRVEHELVAPKVRERRETFVEVAALADDAAETSLFARAPKRLQIYEHVLGQPGRRIAMRRLFETFGSASTQIRSLEEAGLLRRVQHEVYREVWLESESSEVPTLSPHQREAVATICHGLGNYGAYLLHGVTASGKTEVYLQAISQALDAGRSALVLVPEISLTHQVVARLVGRFGPTVAVLHSELSPGERWDQWRRICRGEARIAVGARSAVLAPIAELGIVVVDEEHDAAYKQEDGVRYNARDVAVMRAKHVGCPVVLGSATPSIESRQRAEEGAYLRIVLPERVTARPLPNVEVVDLRGRDIVATGGLSDHLAILLERNLADRGQSLLFLNRRGYASYLQCYECGEIVQCDHCSVGMTLHRAQGELRCHHCNCVRATPTRCPTCSADALLDQGLGTQRLELAAKRLLPSARIDRLDRDAAERKGTTQRVLAAWRRGEIDVLIGTQMITKGHDAPGVTLVGVVQADLGLGVPDFRASERTFQLLAQVAGRAGRGDRRGRVIFQTYRPDHPAVAAAARHDYEAFAAAELREREELAYPPYSRMAVVRLEGIDRAGVEQLASAASRVVLKLAGLTGDSDPRERLIVRGPAPCPLEKIKRRYRYQVQLRARDHRIVRHAAAECRRLLQEAARRAKVRLIVDVDPMDML